MNLMKDCEICGGPFDVLAGVPIPTVCPNCASKAKPALDIESLTVRVMAAALGLREAPVFGRAHEEWNAAYLRVRAVLKAFNEALRPETPLLDPDIGKDFAPSASLLDAMRKGVYDIQGIGEACGLPGKVGEK